MIQKDFADKVIQIIKHDPEVIGLAAAGSWITSELDEFSDLDLILVTKHKVAGSKPKMLGFATRFGKILSAFTGEHVGEPRLLICLYDQPLLHVDIKFITPPEFHERVENPVILFERDKQLSKIIDLTTPEWPMPDYQWIEDRFWVWVHYIAGKIARGEYFEAMDGLGIIRKIVLAPLLHIKNKNIPKALRKVEMQLGKTDLDDLKKTLPQYDSGSLKKALRSSIDLYQSLRRELFPKTINQRQEAEQRSLEYFID
jgi:hypothetical protein